MSQAIPGGRPRASSDGDILDEGFCGGLLNSHTQSSRIGDGYSLGPGRLKDSTQVKAKNSTSSKKLDSSEIIPRDNHDDAFDSDGGISSRSSSSVSKVHKRTRRLSFKSMKKAVSRAFEHNNKQNVKSLKTSTSKPNDSASGIIGVSINDQFVITHLGKIWTPELRRIGKSHSDMNGNSNSGLNHKKSTMSSARPLVMEPDIEMTIPKWKDVPGTIGIYNHGNSCFINTIIQCLSNTDSFTEYFVQEFFKTDLKQNRNSKKSVLNRSPYGEVTEQLAYLLKSLWCGNYHGDISKEFKVFVGKYNDQYRGDHQQDAQEFLLWLLDRLHEDLCTPPKKKTKAQKNSSNNKSEEELSVEALSANGESFVLKLFQALHSSTLTCPSCSDRSSTYDPYLCVSLPLPQSCPRVMYVIIVSLQEYPKEVKYAFTLNQFDCIKELRESISAETGFPPNQFILCQLKDSGFGATFSNEQPLSDIAETETIYAIETFSDEEGADADDSEFDSPKAQVLLVHVETLEDSRRGSSLRFGEPTVLKVKRDISWSGLHENIVNSMDETLYADFVPQKHTALFLLKVYDGSSCGYPLPSDIDMPLYTQAAERAFNTLSEDFGPNHIKIMVIWNTQTKNKVIQDDGEHIKINQSVRNVNTNPPSQVSLDECFRLYTQEEKLNGEDAWLCPHCKEQQQGIIKSLGLWSLPDVLILHLKRFKQTSMRRSKLNTLVDFPVDNLNMSPHLANKTKIKSQLKSDDCTYDLIGVSNHYGNMMGGHYTAFCRSPVDGNWRQYNDHKVTALDGPVATKEAYILFYQRRSLTKDVNQKLFTGDHWVFTLPLSSTNKIEEPVKTGLSTLEEPPLSPRTRRTRSRSSSPMSRRHANANGTSQSPTSPLPSPTRQARTLHRQHSSSSSSGLMARRGKSANALPSSTNYLTQTRIDDIGEMTSVKTNKADKKGKENYNTINNRKPVPIVIKHQLSKDSDSGHSDSKEKEIIVPITTTLSSNTSHVSTSSTSGKALNDLKSGLNHNNEILSDAKYPSSHLSSSSIVKEHRSMNNSSLLDFPQESAGALRVNLENIDGTLSSQTATAQARKKLAELRRDLTYESQNGYSSSHSSSKLSARNTHTSPRYSAQTSYDVAQNNPIMMDLESLSFKDSLSESGKHRSKNGPKSLPPDSYYQDFVLGRSDRDSFTCSPLREEPENYILYPDQGRYVESSLHPRIDKERLRNLAHKHFGEPQSFNHLERSLDYIPSHYTQTDMYKKYATIARSRELTTSSRVSNDSMFQIPRSSTDQNIRYNDLAPGFIAPPSPTPPHSFREERSLGAHLNSNVRHPNTEFPSLPAYDLSSHHQLDDRSSLASSRHSALYSTGRFSRPRGVWGVKVKPHQKLPVEGNLPSVSKVPSPCLRESSV